jgi:ribosomal protein S18 acetylase RimI-like enzyme
MKVDATYVLRRSSPRDAAGLQAACWPEWSLDSIRELLVRVDGIAGQGRGLGVVACIDDQILGYGQLTLWPRAAEISDLIVTPALRGNGVGTAIITHLIDQARTWHLDCVEIGAALSNPRAMALYRRLGFTEDRIIELDLGSGLEPVMYLSMCFDGHPPKPREAGG